MNDRPHPVAGEDYPRTYQEFLEWFADEPACRRYLARIRWPKGLDVLSAGEKPNHGRRVVVTFIVGSAEVRSR